MAEAFNQWLQRKAKVRGWNQSTLARELGEQAQSLGRSISASAVQKWWTGGTKPEAANAALIADVLGTPRDEVFFLLQLPSETTPASTRIRPAHEVLLEALSRQPVAIPIHDQTASAGFGQSVIEYAYWEPPQVAGRNIVGLHVRGDSMEPEIMDGDTIFIDRDLPAEVGNTVVATIGDEVVVKKLRRKGGKLVLVGRTGELDADNAKIEGVVIELNRKIRR